MVQKSLKLNFIMNMILTMSSLIFPLITFPYVSRILLVEGTGKISFVTSIIAYFAMFSQLGIPFYGVRACAKVRDDKEKLKKTVQELFFMNLIMTIIVYSIFIFSLFFVPKMQEEAKLLIIVSSTIIFNLIGFEWLYKALEEYRYIAIRSIIFKFIALILMFVLVREEQDYLIYGAISIFASSASSILNFINLRKYINIFSLMGNYDIRRHLKPILIFFALSCATIMYANLDTVMIGFIKSSEDVGYYNAAVKIKAILVSIVTSLGVVILPRASYYIEKNMMDKFYDVSAKAINFVICIAIPMTVYFILYAKESVRFLSGNTFDNAILPMQIILPTIIFIGLTNIMGIQILVPTGREKYVLYSVVAGAIINLIINSVLISKISYTGAAISNLVAEFVVLIVQIYVLKDIISKIFRDVSIKYIAGALVIATIVGVTVKYFGLSIFFTLALSSILFFGMYYVVLLLFKEPLVLEVTKQVFGKVLKKVKNRTN